MTRRLPANWRTWIKSSGWVVIYTNQGKREVSPVFPTAEDAAKNAEFLRFQGAKRVRIERV